MKTKRLLILIAGAMTILLGLFHVMFWFGLLDWDTQLPLLSVINSNVMQMLNLAVILLLVGLGILMVSLRTEIARTKLGRAILWIMVAFYVARLAEEFIFPEPSLPLAAILAVFVAVTLAPALMRNE